MQRSVLMAVVAAALAASSAKADQKPVFYKDVLPILQENCQICHRPGGANLGGMVAPMALTTYEEVRPWAKAIATQVTERNMPPWKASPAQHGQFENERTLTQAQIDTLARWAETGASGGDPADAPAPISLPPPNGWLIGEPDLVADMPKPHFVGDDVADEWVHLPSTLTPEMLPEKRWVKAYEIRPGSSMVHHIIVDPVGGIVPGNTPGVLPEGIGVPLAPGQAMNWEIHYHKEKGPGTGEWDRSRIAIKFYPKGETVKYQLRGNLMARKDFTIPAGDPHYTLRTEYVFEHDSKIVFFRPHMHTRGKSATYEAFFPDGTSEILLDVPRYDFNWQNTYQYKKLKNIPAGTRIVFTSVFDNSPNNSQNPDPTVSVKWGRESDAEMSQGKFFFIDDSGLSEAAFPIGAGPDVRGE